MRVTTPEDLDARIEALEDEARTPHYSSYEFARQARMRREIRDLEALRSWVREGRIGAHLIGQAAEMLAQQRKDLA